MPHRPPVFAPARPRKAYDHRPNARQRGYTNQWDKARRAYLSEHPLCVRCMREGNPVAATVVDHIVPHRRDMQRFWDAENNWQSLCAYHHNVKTATEDRITHHNRK